MKKYKVVALMLGVFMRLLSLVSCMFKLDSKTDISKEKEYMKETFENLMINIQNKSSEKIQKMFASDVVSLKENFKDDIEKLFNYFDGNYTSYLMDATHSSAGDYKGVYIETVTTKFEIYTEQGQYRMFLRAFSSYSGDESREGIKCLYIIKAEDDTDLETAYSGDVYSLFGDYNYTPGINIDVVNSPRKKKVIIENFIY